jgi:hypothetical protein
MNLVRAVIVGDSHDCSAVSQHDIVGASCGGLTLEIIRRAWLVIDFAQRRNDRPAECGSASDGDSIRSSVHFEVRPHRAGLMT